MDFLSGEFTYMADAAMFRDCATGLRFPVAQTGDYLRTEREYTARSQGVGDPVHVRLRGHIDLMPSAEESQGLVPTLVIDSLLGFDDNQACNPGVMMVGIYVSEDGSGRSVLHLRSDYTCSFQNYGADGSAERDRMLSALRAAFPPEFLNRVDEILVFRPLGREELVRIAHLMLEEVCRRALELDIGLSFDQSAAELIATAAQSGHGGARPIRRAVVRLVEDAFSTELLEGRLSTGDRVRASARDGKIVFESE